MRLFSFLPISFFSCVTLFVRWAFQRGQQMKTDDKWKKYDLRIKCMNLKGEHMAAHGGFRHGNGDRLFRSTTLVYNVKYLNNCEIGSKEIWHRASCSPSGRIVITRVIPLSSHVALVYLNTCQSWNQDYCLEMAIHQKKPLTTSHHNTTQMGASATRVRHCVETTPRALASS